MLWFASEHAATLRKEREMAKNSKRPLKNERDNRTPEERLAHDAIRKRVETEGSAFDQMSQAAKGEVVDRALGRKRERVKAKPLASASDRSAMLSMLSHIREIADGRRHYDGAENFTCFDALGEIRDICDKVVSVKPVAAPVGKPQAEQAPQDTLGALGKLVDAADTYMTSDPQMSSHAETERDLERAIETARTLLKRSPS